MQKTAYELRISDWSSDVFSSDLCRSDRHPSIGSLASASWTEEPTSRGFPRVRCPPQVGWVERSETHHRRRSATDGFRCALPILRSLYPSYGQVSSDERPGGKEGVS